MRSKPCMVMAFALLASAAPALAAFAQEPTPGELKPEVAAFTAMHNVIMPMWHEAVPARDIKALTKLLPSIERHVSAVAKADLPGILGDKKTPWEDGVRSLQAAAAEYRAAITGGNADAILKAAEVLHARYEALGRVIQPVMPDLESFHVTLYVIYKYQINPLQFEKLAGSVPELKARMDALSLAHLPEEFSSRAAAFNDQRARLAAAVDMLVVMLQGKNEQRVIQQVELVRIEYLKLDRSLTG